MSRYLETTQILISDDTSNQPQNIRFDEEISDIDVTSLTQILNLSPAQFAPGTTAINMQTIATGLWLYIKPTAALSLIINGQAPLDLQPGKSTKMWATFTSISVVNPGTTVCPCTLVIGG